MQKSQKVRRFCCLCLAVMMSLFCGCSVQDTSEVVFSPTSSVVSEAEGSILTEESMSGQEENEMQTEIRITVNGKSWTAALEDTPSVRALLEKLPLTLTMQELNGNEKYYRFSDSFPTKEERMEEIHAGDLMLYQSQYLVLFYEDHPTSYRYTRLGQLQSPSGLAEAAGAGAVEVSFERIS